MMLTLDQPIMHRLDVFLVSGKPGERLQAPRSL